MIASLYEKNRHHLRVLMNTAFLWVKEVHFRKLATSVTFKKRMVSTYCNKNIYTVYFKHCWHWEGTKTKENLEKQGFFFTVQRFNRCRIIEQETVFVHYLDKQGQASTTLVDIASLECVTAEGICSCNYNQLGDLDSWRRDTEKKSKWGAISMKLVSW